LPYVMHALSISFHFCHVWCMLCKYLSISAVCDACCVHILVWVAISVFVELTNPVASCYAIVRRLSSHSVVTALLRNTSNIRRISELETTFQTVKTVV
jgi:hypothetical protein